MLLRLLLLLLMMMLSLSLLLLLVVIVAVLLLLLLLLLVVVWTNKRCCCYCCCCCCSWRWWFEPTTNYLSHQWEVVFWLRLNGVKRRWAMMGIWGQQIESLLHVSDAIRLQLVWLVICTATRATTARAIGKDWYNYNCCCCCCCR